MYACVYVCMHEVSGWSIPSPLPPSPFTSGGNELLLLCDGVGGGNLALKLASQS